MSTLRYGLGMYCPIKLKEDDPEHAAIAKLKVIFNQVLWLLTSTSRKDKVRVETMLKKLGWLSINQMCIETRLPEAWKTTGDENYCLKCTTLRLKKNSSSLPTTSQELKKLEQMKSSRLGEQSFQQLILRAYDIKYQSLLHKQKHWLKKKMPSNHTWQACLSYGISNFHP